MEKIDTDALLLHLDPLQEALQVAGNTNWCGILHGIESVCAKLAVSVIIKKVRWGISAEVARQLVDANVSAIDIVGAGGTSWIEVERHRAPTHQLRRVACAFGASGIPTADSLLMARAAAAKLPLIASGGLRSGVEAATANALGADLIRFAGPLLRAAAVSKTGAQERLTALIDELRASTFSCGAGDSGQLKQVAIISDSPQE